MPRLCLSHRASAAVNNPFRVDQSGAGRGVYVGANIGGQRLSGSEVTATAELMFENAVAWAAGKKVTAPAALPLLLAAAPLFLRRFRRGAR